METKIKKTRNYGPRKDITGQKFGRLTALYYIKGGKWHCKCDCGNEIDVDTRNLNTGHTKSCGCLLKEKNSKNNTINMIGYENDGIIVLDRAPSDKNGYAHWKCKCKICGREFISAGYHIRQGLVKSCGCVHSHNERNIIKLLEENNIPYQKEYTFPDLKGERGGALRFDFAIFNKDGRLSHLLEYNGQQHYIKVPGKWGEDFEINQRNDQKKIDYCKTHNIELRIIPFYQNYTLEDLI